ncbi:response regulator [Chroococcidiopsis sp. FACHB-1243]|uniref:hybrid sensor histidine kinase/response regulator n=1 Tax=Chroococcidiopsis sp. [FACHB-1243] TaxID=2692781 RepID=UPI0017832D50|nr:hybrid sensor histidine kinase/response regulator [Chroococcidiopsis sp. [FACHB-1243]]MBD2305732.1 response regulator [Chroococcidiopsis sp. [FACHB-1243]]
MNIPAKILVVEDEGIVAKDIENRLQKFGYHVCKTIATGEEAIARVSELKPDLVLVDIRLQGDMDGIAVAQVLHHNFELPVVYLTANSDEHIVNRALATQPFGYIIKPFREQELKITIEIALNKYLIEQNLKQNKYWLRTVLKNINDGVIASDTEGKIAFMNPIAEALTGWNRQDACGKEATEVVKTIPTQTISEHPIQQALQKGITVEISERSQLIDKNGLEIPIDDRIAPIKDDRGNIVGTMLVFQDISEREQVEAMHQKQIEQEQMLVQMEKMHELKDDFLSTVSHELRTPIANMKMAIQMLKTSPSSEKRQRYLEILQAECNREAELITELLDLQRLETASYPILVQEAINLQEWLPQIMEPFLIRAQENQQLLEIRLDPNLSQILTDRGSLEQAIAELANNACKYTPEGGMIVVSVSYQAAEKKRAEGAEEAEGEKRAEEAEGAKGAKIPLTTPHTPQRQSPQRGTPPHGAGSPTPCSSRTTHHAPRTAQLPTTNYQLPATRTIFTVRNQAEIPAAELPKIFEKFYRIHNSDRWKQGGTGLGLTLVQKLVEHLEGTLQVESQEGWTTFTIELPNGAGSRK